MTTSTPPPVTRRSLRRRRPRATVTSVLGELFLTAGVLVLLFVAWQMWVGDWIIGAENNAKGNALTMSWEADPAPAVPPVVNDDGTQTWDPPTLSHPDEGEVFATMRIPRFGADYNVSIAGGTTRSVTLDPLGIGLYEVSKMPGEVGNFSLAGHRTTWGKPFADIDRLRLDDAIVVETREGWYTYRFRTLEYVQPTRVDVLADVPQAPGEQPGERYISLTACSPRYSLAERIIAYGVFEGFHPRSEGPPASLTEEVS